MKFFTKLFAAAAVTASAVASPAMAGPYVNIGIGTGFGTEADVEYAGIEGSVDARTSFGGGVGLGYSFDNNVRVEGKVFRTTAGADSVTVGGVKYDYDESGSAWNVGLDVEYDFSNDSKATPYVGVGIAYGWADEGDSSDVGYSAVAGVSYEVTDKNDIYAEVSYSFSPEDDVDGVDVDAYGEFGITAGVRFAF